jgi:hypothetical protein
VAVPNGVPKPYAVPLVEADGVLLTEAVPVEDGVPEGEAVLHVEGQDVRR